MGTSSMSTSDLEHHSLHGGMNDVTFWGEHDVDALKVSTNSPFRRENGVLKVCFALAGCS